jgi:hypothetical protein
MNRILEKGTEFIMRNARLLERSVFEHQIFNISPDRIIRVLRAYQNPDGGFGHALEPDLRCPDSQPLFVEFALRTLYEVNLRDEEIAKAACGFLRKFTNLNEGIPTIFPASRCFSRAVHWDNPTSELPSMERLCSLVGLLNWQKIDDDWLKEAVETCLKYISTNRNEDAHTIMNSFCLLESVENSRDVEHLFYKLKKELFTSQFFKLEVKEGYGLTPLDFAPSPDAYCRKIFSDSQIDAHLNDLISSQSEDGGWQINWQPPSDLSKWEWRGFKTAHSLAILRAYSRI